jgi:hypothetical protein
VRQTSQKCEPCNVSSWIQYRERQEILKKPKTCGDLPDHEGLLPDWGILICVLLNDIETTYLSINHNMEGLEDEMNGTDF